MLDTLVGVGSTLAGGEISTLGQFERRRLKGSMRRLLLHRTLCTSTSADALITWTHGEGVILECSEVGMSPHVCHSLMNWVSQNFSRSF